MIYLLRTWIRHAVIGHMLIKTQFKETKTFLEVLSAFFD